MGNPSFINGKLLGKPFYASVDATGEHRNRGHSALLVHGYLVQTGYAAYILDNTYPEEYARNLLSYCPYASIFYDIDQSRAKLNDYDIISVSSTGVAHRVYSTSSSDNVLFITNQCNSNCIMCPDSDMERKRESGITEDYLMSLVSLMPESTPHITITGGEPTLLKWGLLNILACCRDHLSQTSFLMLSNGRSLCVPEYREAFLEAKPHLFQIGVPLYSDIPSIHDSITRVPGSFLQTVSAMKGLQGRADLEVRIVVMQATYKSLPAIATYIVREIPATKSVSLMGLELLGNAAIRRDKIWVNHEETAPYLDMAVGVLTKAGIEAKIYNYPLCALPRKLWPLAARSITDYKVRHMEQCEFCAVRKICGGFFYSVLNYRGASARPVKKDEL